MHAMCESCFGFGRQVTFYFYSRRLFWIAAAKSIYTHPCILFYRIQHRRLRSRFVFILAFVLFSVAWRRCTWQRGFAYNKTQPSESCGRCKFVNINALLCHLHEQNDDIVDNQFPSFKYVAISEKTYKILWILVSYYL